MVDHRARDPVLASYRARGFAVASAHTSLLVWLARAGQFPATLVSEVSRRDSSLLLRCRVHSDDDRHVLSLVSTEGRTRRRLQLRAATRTVTGRRRLSCVRNAQCI